MDVDKLISLLDLSRTRILEDELIASCPFVENHKDGDRHPSWALNLDKLVYHCFACKESGTLLTLVTKLFGCSYDEALEMLATVDYDPISHQLRPKSEVKNYSETVSEAFLTEFNQLNEFVFEGMVDGHNCWVFPVRDVKGSLVGAVARSKEGRWHKNFLGLKRATSVYGIDTIRHNQDVIVCEGIRDALALRSFNFNSVALLGSEMSSQQADILLSVSDSFIIWLDNDFAGHKGTEKIINSFDRLAYVRYINTAMMDENEKDPRDFCSKRNYSEIEEFISNAKPALLWRLEFLNSLH